MNPFSKRLARACEPPPKLLVSDWANQFRYLSKESSASANKYRTSSAPYQAEPMDAANDDTAQAVCVMFASQTGKTEILNNIVGYFIDCDPAPMLMVQPSIEFGESWSKERLVPMLRDCACFDGKVKESRSRDSGNTILHKQFPGGNIAIVGANAPTGLAGRPRRVVLLDEVDRYPASAGTEGDPVSLAIRRTESFWNSVIVMTSTPTIKGVSRIEKEFEQTDQRYWFVPCPHCGEFQTLKWSNVKWPDGEPEKATIECEKCQAKLDDADRVAMIKRGEWRPTAPFNGKRGYHLNGIYSPFKAKRGYKNRIHQMAAQFLEAKHGGEETLKTWVNTFLAETWEADGTKLEAGDISQRREDYEKPPEQVLVMTWAADVQADRIEAEIIGWGIGEESWSLKRGYFIGDPNKSDDVWRQLYDFAHTTFQHPLYGQMRPQIGCVDSAYATANAYAFARRCAPMNVWPIRGSANKLKSLVESPRRNSRSQALLVDVGEFKTVIYSRLKIVTPGPRMMHFPREYDDEYFAQLTAEKFFKRVNRGVVSARWENTRSNKRNEALDIRVYNHAALHLLNVVDWERLKANMESRIVKPTPPADVAEPAKQPPTPTAKKAYNLRRPSKGFARNW